ncbi:MAG: GDYXXLXY domain-containing protein [Thermoguttaceae bacterium]|nr:GDYXXLXY domain-containing protein [Thermoguttaceae bacterium]
MKHSISNKMRQWLLTEMQFWSERGVLTSEQETQILALYESRFEFQDRRRHNAIFLLMSFAALLSGLGILLLVGAHWDKMAVWSKLTILFGGMLVIHGIAIILRYRRTDTIVRSNSVTYRSLTSESFLFLGCLLYGASIWLIAQIFHIESHYPNGFWFWAIGFWLMAFCGRTPILHLGVIVTSVLWICNELIYFGTYTPVGSWYLADLCWTLPIFVFTGIAWGLHWRSNLVLRAYLALFGLWVLLWSQFLDGSFIGVGFLIIPAALSAAYFGVDFALSRIPQTSEMTTIRTLGTLCRQYGVLSTMCWLLVWSFEAVHIDAIRSLAKLYTNEWNDGCGESSRWIFASFAVGAVMLVVITTVVTLWLVRCFLRKNPSLGYCQTVCTPSETAAKDSHCRSNGCSFPWMSVGLMLFVFGIAGILWCGAWCCHGQVVGYGWRPSEPLFTLIAVLCVNAVILLGVIALIRNGLRENSGESFACGTFLFLIWTICRYCDLFFEAGGMLGASCMFFACGFFLYGVSWFWYRYYKVRLTNLTGSDVETSVSVPPFSSLNDLKYELPSEKTCLATAENLMANQVALPVCAPFWAACQRREWIVLLVAIVVQMAVLMGMILTRTIPYLESQGGKTVLLRVRPVDPRDMMRGDYVRLGYDFGRPPQDLRLGHAHEIFLTLKLDADGVHYLPGEYSLTRPSDAVYLRGQVYGQDPAGRGTVTFGIDSYYIPEGTGEKWETAIQSTDTAVYAQIAISADGYGQVKALIVESSSPST